MSRFCLKESENFWFQKICIFLSFPISSNFTRNKMFRCWPNVDWNITDRSEKYFWCFPYIFNQGLISKIENKKCLTVHPPPKKAWGVWSYKGKGFGVCLARAEHKKSKHSSMGPKKLVTVWLESQKSNKSKIEKYVTKSKLQHFWKKFGLNFW